MRFGLKVNPATWEEASRWASVAEDAGFDGLWTGDNARNARDPSVPVHDGPTIIAAWAATTTRVRIGLLIANMALRQPTLLAKQAVTLDHVSAGRFELGIGSGLWPADRAMAGVPMWSARERAERLGEFVGIVDRLLAGDVSDHEGRYYSYREAAMSPASIQARIPFIVAADGPKALAVVAEHADAWATFPGAAAAEDFHRTAIERGRVLDRLCEERGRDPGALRRILLAYGAINPWASADGFARLVDDYREIGFDEIVCYAPKPEERAVFDQVVDRLVLLSR
jgi:alkanesulfonate monooxygenase SsuD/methylene tetrahydromethanopterin reductase-like flavin-dependent oxidoreductase (luciferase family)